MKKIFLKIGILLVAIIFCLSAAACFGEDGKSAYQIACDNGFSGTEQQWLDSLSGKNGKNGLDGQDAAELDIYGLFDAYLQIHPETTFEEFLQSFLIVDYYDTEYAASVAICSAVKIRTRFQRTSGSSSASLYYSEGAGVVYRRQSSDAYIITNYHVVYSYDSITPNGLASEILVFCYGSPDPINAEFIGGSKQKDIAVIRVDDDDLPSFIKEAEIADSNDVSLGERTVAVGNPLAEGISVTSGVISVDSEEIKIEALDSPDSTVEMRVIRTDTPINRGNSGGGLFNIRGRLIGIINAKTFSDGVESMGYAIPSNVAAGIADCVIDNNAKKCVLGIAVTALSQSVRYNTGKDKIEIIESITVHEVTAGALAEGKLLADDVLLAATLNDKRIEITRIFHLGDFLYKARGGDVLQLEIRREEALLTLEITVLTSLMGAV